MKVSILVRAKNDEAIIGRTLEAIYTQESGVEFEVLVCDDGSSDRTHEIASRFPVHFIEPPNGPYKPGRTLNSMVQSASGDIIVFNNSDAMPLDSHWLSSLLAPLLSSPESPRFTFANQLPRPDAQGLVRKDHERAFGDGKVQSTWRFFFSLASSATWRKLLIETPFDENIQYSEDVEWAWRNSRREKNRVEIIYCPDARVEHSHNYTLRELCKRFKGEGTADHRIFGDSPSLPHVLGSAMLETLRDLIYLATRPRFWHEIPVAPVRRLVQRISYWQGTQSSC